VAPAPPAGLNPAARHWAGTSPSIRFLQRDTAQAIAGLRPPVPPDLSHHRRVHDHLAEIAARLPESGYDSDVEFEWGLDLILDGLARLRKAG